MDIMFGYLNRLSEKEACLNALEQDIQRLNKEIQVRNEEASQRDQEVAQTRAEFDTISSSLKVRGFNERAGKDLKLETLFLSFFSFLLL